MFNFQCGGLNNQVHTLVSGDVIYAGLTVCANENNTSCVVFIVRDHKEQNERMSGFSHSDAGLLQSDH